MKFASSIFTTRHDWFAIGLIALLSVSCNILTPIDEPALPDHDIVVMNRVGYDFVTPGNHEFDFGIAQMQNLLMDNLDATVVNANFCHYSSTGTKFQYMGVLTIGKDGRISTYLVETESYAGKDADIEKFVAQVEDEATKEGKTVIGHSDFELSINGTDGKRIVRSRETALGNFVTDSYRNYFNTEIAVTNGGGIRETVKAGDITYNDLLAVSPFGNTLSSGTISGQQLLDALDFCYSVLPAENGGFMQINGMDLSIDTSVNASFELSQDNMFVGVRDGLPRRISNLKILDPNTGRYESVDPERCYTIETENQRPLPEENFRSVCEVLG